MYATLLDCTFLNTTAQDYHEAWQDAVPLARPAPAEKVYLIPNSELFERADSIEARMEKGGDVTTTDVAVLLEARDRQWNLREDTRRSTFWPGVAVLYGFIAGMYIGPAVQARERAERSRNPT